MNLCACLFDSEGLGAELFKQFKNLTFFFKGNHITTRKKHVRVLEKETIADTNIGLSESTKQSSSSALNNSGNGLKTLNSETHCSEIKSKDNSSLPLSSIVSIFIPLCKTDTC